MLKKSAFFCFISAILIYAVTIIVPFFLDPNSAFILFKLALIIFAIGVILGMIHVLNERKQEKKNENWNKYKDY